MGLPALVASPQLAVGIELTWLGGGSWVARACQLRRAGAVVTVQQQASGLLDLPALVAALGPEPGPVALVLAGRGLVLRTLAGPALVPDAAQVAALLPGTNPADFYCQYAPGPTQTLVALVRRAPVQELLAALAEAGLWVLAVQLGPLGLPELLPYLPADAHLEPLPAGPFLVQLTPDGQHLASASTPPAEELPTRPYELGGEAVPAAQVLAYAAALALLTGAPGPGQLAALPEVQQQQAEWGQRRWFRRLRLGVPVGILALLLGNQLASQYLTARQDELSGVTGGSQHLLARVRAAQRTVGQQQAFLAATGWTRPSVNSLCADRLAATLPAGIQLLTVDINPAQELPGQGTGAAPHFRPGVVTVRGQCASAQQFNAWLQRLTRQPWVGAVRDQNFAYDYAGGLGTFTFTLLLDEEALNAD
jgi:hypothetical protein